MLDRKAPKTYTDFRQMMAKEKLEIDPEAARQLVEEAHEHAKLAIVELRDLARGISPVVLTDRGLDAALSARLERGECGQ